MKFSFLDSERKKLQHGLMPVAWFEGLQLLPQHFQAIDARVDAIAKRHLKLTQPYFWGIDQLSIDLSALSSGKLSIENVAGCFADGLVFDWNSTEDGILQCELDSSDQSARYSLVIAAEDFNENYLRMQRYEKLISISNSDLGVYEDQVSIIRWKPNILLKKYSTDNPRYLQIPIIEIIKSSRGFETAEYHPPSLRLIVGSNCHKNLVSLCKLLRQKALLVKAKRVTILSNDEFHNSLGWVFGILASSLVELECGLNDDAAMPIDIYRIVCKIIAGMSSLSAEIPVNLPTYSHIEINNRINELVEIVKAIVGPIGIDHRVWHAYPFQLMAGEWRVAIPNHISNDELLVEATFDPVAPSNAVQSWLENAFIFLSGQKEQFRGLRVRGLDRRFESEPMNFDVPRSVGSHVFRIYIGDSIASSIQSLFIENPDERHGLKIKSITLMQRSDNVTLSG